MLHNLGSINLDHVYRVTHLVRPGETLASHDYRVGLGGKGANQSLAMALAGGRVRHWGRLNAQDDWARDQLVAAGVDASGIAMAGEPSGHAIIQVDDAGENAILLFGGANHGITDDDLDALFADVAPGDWVLVQNECNALPRLFDRAAEHDLAVAFNPAPMTPSVRDLSLSACRLLFVNRTEAAALVDLHAESPAQALLDGLARALPHTETVLTLGGEGAWYQHGETRRHQPALAVSAVDTTGAGDTFIGYYLAAHQAGLPVAECLARATAAAALGVQRPGAAESIPHVEEVDRALREALASH